MVIKVQLLKGEEKFNVQFLQDESVKNFYMHRLSDVFNKDYEGNADEIYEYLTTQIKKTAYEVMGVGKKGGYRTSWMTE
jgi:hypothetical protein